MVTGSDPSWVATIGVPFLALGFGDNAMIRSEGQRLQIEKAISFTNTSFEVDSSEIRVNGGANGNEPTITDCNFTERGQDGFVNLRTPMTLAGTLSFDPARGGPATVKLSKGPFTLPGVESDRLHMVLDDQTFPTVSVLLAGGAGDASLVNRGVFEWFTGRIAGNSKFINDADKTIRLSGTGSKFFGSSALDLGGEIENSGRMMFGEVDSTTYATSTGPITLENGASIRNLQGGEIVFNGGAGILLNGANQGSVLLNQGTIFKNIFYPFGVSSTTTVIGVPIDNEGTVRCKRDTLLISKPELHYDAVSKTFRGGRWIAENGGTIRFGLIDRVERIGPGTYFRVSEFDPENPSGFFNNSNQSIFRDGAGIEIQGSFDVGPGADVTVDEIEVDAVFPGSLGPDDGQLIVGGRLVGESYTANSGYTVIEPGGSFVCEGGSSTGGSLQCAIGGEMEFDSFAATDTEITIDGDFGDLAGGGPPVVITVTGGTIGGSGNVLGDLLLDGGADLSPGSSPGTLTVNSLTLDGVTSYTWEIDDFAGTEGISSDLVENGGDLTLTPTPGSPLTIRLATLDGSGMPGAAANWDPSQPGSWVLVRNAGLTGGFSADSVIIDPTDFLNPTFGGRFDVAVADTDLVLNFTPSDFAVWQLAEFPNPSDREAGQAGDLLADPDGDGKPNFLEYALGCDPHSGGEGPPLQFEFDGIGESRTVTASFSRRASANDLHLFLESSDGLGPGGWATLAESLRGAPMSGAAGLLIDESGDPIVSVDLEGIPAPASELKQFFRLRAVQVPPPAVE